MGPQPVGNTIYGGVGLRLNAQLTWLQNNFSPQQLGNPAISGLLAEPAGDGVPNLVKYAFNIGSFVDGQPFLPHVTSAGGQVTLSFLGQQSDVTYTVQASTDLINWSTTGVNSQVNGQQITASYPIPAGGHAFLRVMVSVP